MTSRRKKWAARAGVAVAVAFAAHIAVIALFVLFGVLAPIGKLTSASSGALASASAHAADDDRPMEIETIVNQLERPDEKSAAEKLREEQQKKEEEGFQSDLDELQKATDLYGKGALTSPRVTDARRAVLRSTLARACATITTIRAAV